MKRQMTLAIVMLLSVSALFAQNEKYMGAMTASITSLNQLDKAKPDVKALQEIANQFERVAGAEPNEWLPGYYAANSYILLGFYGKDLLEKDNFLDKAEGLLKKSESILGKPNDEILVLKAYLAQSRLAADPVNRWEKYGALFTDFLSAAKGVNGENPRIYYLEGQSLFFTPEEYGGGKKVAKPLLDKAIQKFSTFKPESSIHPNWGKSEAEWMAAQGK